MKKFVHDIIIGGIILGGILFGIYHVALRLDPREPFSLEHVTVLTEKDYYEPGDQLVVRFEYCSESDTPTEVTVNYELQNHSPIFGDTKSFRATNVCPWAAHMDLLTIPTTAHSLFNPEMYTVDFTLEYQVNKLKTKTIYAQTQEFEIRNEEFITQVRAFDEKAGERDGLSE